jgi:hypothetical protein
MPPGATICYLTDAELSPMHFHDQRA